MFPHDWLMHFSFLGLVQVLAYSGVYQPLGSNIQTRHWIELKTSGWTSACHLGSSQRSERPPPQNARSSPDIAFPITDHAAFIAFKSTNRLTVFCHTINSKHKKHLSANQAVMGRLGTRLLGPLGHPQVQTAKGLAGFAAKYVVLIGRAARAAPPPPRWDSNRSKSAKRDRSHTYHVTRFFWLSYFAVHDL